MKYLPTYGSFLLFVWCLFTYTVQAQVLNAPVAADNPNLPGVSPWASACGSDDYNEYFVNFTWTPPIVNNDNDFILELSDANGDFTTPTILATVSDQNTNFDFDIGFALPTNTSGDNYKMRVRSTSPEVIGAESDPYAMYYIGYKDPILISENGSGTIPPGGELNACDGQSITMAAHNIPHPENYNYIWYKNGAIIASETTSSLTVADAGSYSVEIDYGASCSGSANTRSNSINVTLVAPLNISISATSDTAICAGQTVNLVSNVKDPNLNYTWYKDGEIVAGPNLGQDLYTVNGSTVGFDGDYYVSVQGNNTCVEESNIITITDIGSFEVTNNQDTLLPLIPTLTVDLSVTDNATNPTYQWYKDGNALAGEIASNITVNEEGEYFVRVSQGGACSSTQRDSEIVTVQAPDTFEITIDYTSGYAACTSADATLSVISIDALFGADRTTVTNDLLNNFTYQWYLEGNPITAETNYALMVAGAANNGDYNLTATLDSYTITSNSLTLQLGSGDIAEITSNTTTLCDNSSATFSSVFDLVGQNFQWLRNGTPINDTNAQLVADTPGIYQLVVQQGDCVLSSNTIELVPFDDSLVNIDVQDEFLLVSGTSVTVTATGALDYAWYNDQNDLIGTESSIIITEPGTYQLVAGSDNCTTTRMFTATLKDEFEVPNVITPNADGINDFWLIPNIYSGQDNITINIYDRLGNTVLQENNYQNNWPSTSVNFTNKNMVFYYIIQEGETTLKQGTITVIR